MKREYILLFASAALLLLTLGIVYRGCRGTKEMFVGVEEADAVDDTDAAKPPPARRAPRKAASPMTVEESKLFEELRTDKYNPDQIDHMVNTGVIDKQLVEKFLNKLETIELPRKD